MVLSSGQEHLPRMLSEMCVLISRCLSSSFHLHQHLTSSEQQETLWLKFIVSEGLNTQTICFVRHTWQLTLKKKKRLEQLSKKSRPETTAMTSTGVVFAHHSPLWCDQCHRTAGWRKHLCFICSVSGLCLLMKKLKYNMFDRSWDDLHQSHQRSEPIRGRRVSSVFSQQLFDQELQLTRVFLLSDFTALLLR